MTVQTRDRGADAPGPRTTGRRAPRSGGRTAAEPHPGRPAAESLPGRPAAEPLGGRTGPRQRSRHPRAAGLGIPATDGTAALAPRLAEEPVRVASARGDRRTTGRRTPGLRVAPPAPVRAPRAPFVALILVLVVGGVLGILLINTKINENAFRLDRLQKQQTALDLQQQQLQKQIAEHEAPGNLAAAARRLGMVDSGPPAFVRLPDGKVIGEPQSADETNAGSGQPGAGG
jgi:hypothetical protein